MLVVSSAFAFRAICPLCRSVLILPFDDMKAFFDGELPRPDWLAAKIECDCQIDDTEADAEQSDAAP